MTEELTPEQEARLEEVRRLRYDGIKAAKKQQDQQAEILYRQALHLHEQVLGALNPAISDSLNQLVFFCAHSGQNAEAKALIERALALLRHYARSLGQRIEAFCGHSMDWPVIITSVAAVNKPNGAAKKFCRQGKICWGRPTQA